MKSINSKCFLLVLLFLHVFAFSFAQSGVAEKKLIGNEQKIEEWKDARFGMFIHWGPVTLKGTEIGWSRGREIPVEEYDNLYKQFNPEKFNADDWVSVAKAAGMKYIVLTTKHHDGFCLWDTRQTDHNIMNSPFKRDVVKELAEACRKQGIQFGTYYSTCDWHHPDFPLTSPGGSITREKSDLDAYTTYLKKQVGELLVNYGPLYVLWFDVPQKFDAVRGQSVIDFAHQIQPDIIINDRTGAKGDFDCPEQRIGGFQNTRPWETCMTIARQWAWKPNDEVKSLEQCLQTLIRSAGGDGNLLFNVGPKPDGSIEPEQIVRLKEMGQWLQKYGYSIYGTRGGPFKPTDWGVSTRKGNTIYLHILKWNGNSPKIAIPNFGMEIKSCRMASGGNLKLTKQDKNYVIEFAGEALQPINTIVEIEVAGNAMDIQPMEIGAQSLSYNKKVSASSNPNPHWTGINSINNGDWAGHAWSPAKEDKEPWAEIDLGKPEKISKAIIYESGQAVKAFEMQVLSGEKWKTVYKGTTIGSKMEVKLPKTTTQKVRMVLKEFSQVPGIYEIVLL
ncbi:MAG TPA: alpha-L-fucosidase [Prolixibacteraceae bacterium]|nr:alpha-L-fucosidase [Prolixibacteraceae bacterium]